MTGRDENGKFIKGSKVNQGRVPSVSQRAKQAAAMRGRVESDEHKEKIRAGLLASEKTIGRPKGGIPWNKGMRRANGDPVPVLPPMSEDGRRRVSEAMSKRMKGRRVAPGTEFKKGVKPWNVGIPCSEATKEKIGAPQRGKILSAETVKRILTRRTPTSLEMKFQGIIEKNNLPYKFVGDGSFMIGRKNPDFININGEKIAIEVYARYYKLRHAETVREWQEDRERVFKEYGWSAIFFDETQVNEANVLSKLRAA